MTAQTTAHSTVRPRLPHVAWLGWIAIWSVVAVGYLDVHDEVASSVVYDAFAVGASLAILLGVRAYRPADVRAWQIMALAFVALAAGDIWYSLMDQAGEVPFPSGADGAYLTGYVGLVLAFGLLFRRSGGGKGALLDAAVFFAGCALVLWTVIVRPSIDASSGDIFSLAVALAYPAMDLILLGLLIRLLASNAARSVSVNLMAVALGVFTAADVIYAVQSFNGTYVTGVLDLGWLIGYALWGAAALHPSMRVPVRGAQESVNLRPRRLVLLAGIGAIGPALIWLEGILFIQADQVAISLASAVMFLLMLWRLADINQRQSALLDERGRLQQILRRQAVEDPLTELPNRRGFVQAVSAALALDPTHTAVVFLDLDDFKSVNDALGHAAGDEFLVTLGTRLRKSLRDGDWVARFGGDEFAVLMRGCASPEAALMIANRLLGIITAPVQLGDQTIRPGASIGVAMGREGATGESLTHDADMAMYHAKQKGKGRVVMLSDEVYGDAMRAIALRGDLAQALAQNQLRLHYQPIVDMSSNRIEAFEALLRWEHPTLGLVFPAEFLDHAEKSGQMVAIGAWVLREACRTAVTWQHGGPVGIHVKVSPTQVASKDLVHEVGSALKAARLDARVLTLELTEMAIENVEAALEPLSALAALGIHIAIDDFGSGFSSLSRVARLPVTALKVDRSLIEEPERRMAGAVVQLGQSLGLEVIAEGVETPAQLARARELGYDAVQGYGLGRPEDSTAAAQRLALERQPLPPERQPQSGRQPKVASDPTRALTSGARIRRPAKASPQGA